MDRNRLPEKPDPEPARNPAGGFPGLAGRLRLILPSVEVRCPDGHKMSIPAQYAAAGRELYCPKCRQIFRPSSPEMKAARRRARVLPSYRSPNPRKMDGLYSGRRGYLPDRLRPALRRAWRGVRRAAGSAGRRLREAAELARGGLAGLAARVLRRKSDAASPPPAPRPAPQARHLAAYQELARAFPAIAGRLRSVLLPEVEVVCPRGHKLSVLAELAAAGREIFCPRCRTAFRPGGEAAASVEAPPAARDAEPAARKPRAARRRVRERMARASGWMISCTIHSALLMVAMLVGVKVTTTAKAEKDFCIESSLEPAREYEMVRVSKDRDIFRKETDEERGSESAEVEKPHVAPELEGREADEITEDAGLAGQKVPPAPVVTEPLETPMAALMDRRGLVLSTPRGAGVTTPIRTGNFKPGVTAGLGPGIMSLRGDPRLRLRAAEKFGGGQETETAVEMALKWLADRQLADGSWWNDAKRKASAESCNYLATTGVATLAFLGAGYSHKHGKHKATVGRALDWLMYNQKGNGSWCRSPARQEMHAQGIAALALIEGCMASPSGEGSEKLKKSAQRAVNFICKAQCPYSAWGYRPYGGRGTTFIENSVVIWNGMALKAAKTAGLRVDGKAFMGMAKWLDDAQGSGGQYAYGGNYTPAAPIRRRGAVIDGGGRVRIARRSSSACLVGASMMMRFWTGTRPGERDTHKSADIVLRGLRQWVAAWEKARDPRAQGGAVKVRGAAVALKPRPQPVTCTPDLYTIHHGTIAMFQMGGGRWKAYNALMKKLVLASQHKDGHWPQVAYAQNTKFSTALGALILESYYRYSPLYYKAPAFQAGPGKGAKQPESRPVKAPRRMIRPDD